MWGRFVHLLGQFEEEHHLYPKFVFDGYDLKQFATLKQQNLEAGKPEKYKLPVLGRSVVNQKANRCMSREKGFNYETATADEDYILERQSMLKEETKQQSSYVPFGPKNVPRFNHPDKKKFEKAIKSDMRLLTFSNSAN